MKTRFLTLLAALTLLTACEILGKEPSADEMKRAIAKWQKIDVSSILDFQKEGCRQGAASHLPACKFKYNIMKDGNKVPSKYTIARFISQDAGTTWTAYEK